MTEKLRVGLLMNSYELPLWEYTLVERLINSHYASIELVVLNGTNNIRNSLLEKIKNNWNYILLILYKKLDKKRFNARPNAFEPKDARNLLSGIPTIIAEPISTKFSDRLLDDDILEIKRRNLDVLVRFGFKILRGDVLSSAKFGVWSYHHGDNNVNRGGPAGFWEVMENWDTTGSILQILTEDLDNGRVLYRSFSQTDKRSVYKNKNNYYWKSLSFLPRKLEELYNIGEVKFFNKIDEQNNYPKFYSNKLFTSKLLNNRRMIGLLANRLLRFTKEKIVNLIWFRQWTLLFSIGNELSTSFRRFKKIIPPKDRFFADPFVIKKENKYYIFIEECTYKNRKGHISVIEMDEKGAYKEPVKVIEKPYHLSYPFIFKNNGDYFLIPESQSNKTIELYKCVEFPYKWEFQMNLMENVEAVDATLFYHQNKWWLFANMRENPGASICDELFLFYSEEFCTKNWIPHPLNPVVSDVRKARPAGNVFIYGEKIMRPSQNSSKRYGFGIKINEIKVLNENEYEEVEISSIEPNWDKQVIATHTFNNAGDLTVIDGVIRRRRYF